MSLMRFVIRAVALLVIVVQLLSCASRPGRGALDSIRASNNPDIIERGRYLVVGPAHCPSCHGERAMSGGRRFNLGPLGTVVAPNISSDPAAGIGAVSDGMLVRSLRYGVARSGRALLPIMPFKELTDRDLQAVISYLRTLEPVPEAAPDGDLSWLGSLAVPLLLKPEGPAQPPLADLAPIRHAESHTRARQHRAAVDRAGIHRALPQSSAVEHAIADALGCIRSHDRR